MTAFFSKLNNDFGNPDKFLPTVYRLVLVGAFWLVVKSCRIALLLHLTGWLLTELT